MSFQKVLIIRLSSIGDIILTSPVLRCLKKQTNATVHYLTKTKYVDIIKKNPNVEKVFSVDQVFNEFNSEEYDLIIDLQKNFKSFFLSMLLKKIKTKYLSYNKKNIKKWVLINFRKDLLHNEHIVSRYFYALRKCKITNDNEGLDYFISSNINPDSFLIKLPFEKSFFAWVLGGSYKNKKLSKDHIQKVCAKVSVPIFFLGGEMEKETADEICKNSSKSNLYNLCGLLSLEESAYVLKKSSIVLTNDTGLMHIASALKKKIISFWGCTKPSLGMFPYKPHSKNIQIITKTSIYPCSKLGDRCRYSDKGCINNISVEEILIAIKKISYKKS